MEETIKLKRDKETKNKIRFSNEPTAPISGSLYLTKEAAGDAQEIEIVVRVTKSEAVAAAPAAA